MVLRSASRVLFLTVFIDLMGYGIVVPMLAFVAKEYGASGMTLGWILGSFSLTQFLFAPVWGRLSDHIGRRPVLIISLLGSMIGFVLFGFASSVIMLFASRILSGIAAASISTAQAYVADITDDTNRSKGMAMIGMAFGLGLVLGPPIGGLLSDFGATLGFAPNVLPGAAAALLSAVALVMAIAVLPESRVPGVDVRAGRSSPFDDESWRIVFTTRALRLAGASVAVLMFTLASLAPLLVLVGRDQYALDARAVGYLFGVMGLTVVAMQGTVERLTRVWGDIGTCIFGALALLLGLLIVPFSSLTLVLIVATALMGVGQALVHPTLSAYISKIAPASHRGGILGVASSLSALARVIGPAFAGFVYDAWLAPGALLTQAAVVLLGIAIAMRLSQSQPSSRAA